MSISIVLSSDIEDKKKRTCKARLIWAKTHKNIEVTVVWNKRSKFTLSLLLLTNQTFQLKVSAYDYSSIVNDECESIKNNLPVYCVNATCLIHCQQNIRKNTYTPIWVICFSPCEVSNMLKTESEKGDVKYHRYFAKNSVLQLHLLSVPDIKWSSSSSVIHDQPV